MFTPGRQRGALAELMDDYTPPYTLNFNANYLQENQQQGLSALLAKIANAT